MTQEQKSLQNEENTKKFKTFYEHYPIVAFSAVISGAVTMKSDKHENYYKFVMYFYLFYITSSYIIILNSIYENFFTNNIVDALKQLGFLNILLLAITKIILGIVHKKKMNIIIKQVDKDYEEANKLEDTYQKVMERSVQDNKCAVKLWIFLYLIVFLFVVSKPFYNMIKSALTENMFSRQMIVEVEVPFINEVQMNSPFYEILAIYTIIIIIILASIFISFDPIFLMLIIHSCANLEIVKSSLRNLFLHEAEEYSAARVRIKMKRIVILHQEIIERVNIMQSIYWPSIFTTFLAATLIICGTMYSLVSSLENGTVEYEILGMFIAPFIYIFVLSFCGEKIIEKSQEVGDAAYCCGWENYPDSSIRKSICLIIMRSQRPSQFSSKFMNLSMTSFSTIIQTSWSYFTLMRSMGDKTART